MKTPVLYSLCMVVAILLVVLISLAIASCVKNDNKKSDNSDMYLPKGNGKIPNYPEHILDLAPDIAMKNPGAPINPEEDPDGLETCRTHNLWGAFNDMKSPQQGPAPNELACGQEIVWDARKLGLLGMEKAKKIADDFFQPEDMAALTPEELEICHPILSGNYNNNIFTPYNIRKAFPKTSPYSLNAEKWSQKPLAFSLTLWGFLQRTTPVTGNWTHDILEKAITEWDKPYSELSHHHQEELCLLSKGLFRRDEYLNGRLQSPCWGCSYGVKNEAYDVDFGDLSPTLGRMANLHVVPNVMTRFGKYGKIGATFGGTVIFMLRFLRRVDKWAPGSPDSFKEMCKSAASKIRWGLLGPLTFKMVCEGFTQSLGQPCCLCRFSPESTLQPDLKPNQANSQVMIGSPIGGGIWMVNLAVVYHLFGLKGVAMYPGKRMPMTPEEAIEACPPQKVGNYGSICRPQPEDIVTLSYLVETSTAKKVDALLKGDFDYDAIVNALINIVNAAKERGADLGDGDMDLEELEVFKD